MRKTFRRITAVALAGLMATCMVVTASAEEELYNNKTENYCAVCKLTTTSTLKVTMTNAVATTSINDGSRGVSVSIYGEYIDKDSKTLKNIGNGSSYTAGVTTKITNKGGTWLKVKSTHSRCCGDSPTTLNW